MAELAQAGSLERLLLWARLAGIVFLLLGVAATFAAGWLSERLDSIRRADVARLESRVQVLEATPVEAIAPVQPESGEASRTAVAAASRQITSQQHVVLVSNLEKFAGAKVNLLTVDGWEPGIYTHQIAKTLRGAGLNVRLGYFSTEQHVDHGLVCYWSRSNPDTGQEMVRLMQDAGVELSAFAGEPKNDAVLEIHVGEFGSGNRQ